MTGRSRATVVALAWLVALAGSIGGPADAAPARRDARDAPLAGRVGRVVDGDSVWFTPTGRAPLQVRLLDIDAPEVCQDGGAEARQALRERVLGRDGVLRPRARDGYGRVLAHLTVDGVDVARRQVEDGHAWSARGRDGRGPLLKEERMARALGRGLHARAGAVPPRDFRREHGPCAHAAATPSGGAVAAPGARPAAGARRAPAPPPRAAAPSPAVPPTATTERRCDGRRRCSQMASCDEARWFLARCPGVAVDGDGDGRPCEDTWCHGERGAAPTPRGVGRRAERH